MARISNAAGAGVAVFIGAAAVAGVVLFQGENPSSVTSPTTTAPPTTTVSYTPGVWPSAGDTGVPAGVTLTTYTGPQIITTDNTIIDGKQWDQAIIIRATNVQIKNSRLNRIDASPDTAHPTWSVTIEDSEFDGGTWPGGTLAFDNITVRRSEIFGGENSIHCGAGCLIEDSWLHGQYSGDRDAHNNAYLSSGGTGVTLRHNTIQCDAPFNPPHDGGCSNDVSFFGDFAPIANITVDHNLFKPALTGGYCLSAGHNPGKTYGSNPTNVSITNNTFERGPTGFCGIYGPATGFLNANGNVWSGNTYEDGETIPAP